MIQRKKDVDGDLWIPGSITVLGGINSSAYRKTVTRVATTESDVSTISGQVTVIEEDVGNILEDLVILTEAQQLAAVILGASTGSITRSRLGTLSPSSVTLTARKQDGSNYLGRFRVYLSHDGVNFNATPDYESVSNEATVSYTPSVSVDYLGTSYYVNVIRVELYTADGFTVFLKRQFVTVFLDSSSAPVYWGSLTPAEEPTSGIIPGDYYFDDSVPGSGGGILRYYTEPDVSPWPEMESSHHSYQQAIITAMPDIAAWATTNSITSGDTLAAATAVINNLVSSTAYIQNLFAQSITVPDGGRIQYETGSGVQKRCVRLHDEKIDWVDIPDTSPASPEQLQFRLGRLGVGGAVLADGKLLTNITIPWSSAGVISAYQCHESDMITMPDGTLASVYRVASSNNIVSRFFDGASWGAEVVVSSGASQGNAVLYVSNSGDLHCIHSYGSLGSIVDRIWSGSSWGGYSTVIADVSYGSLAVIASDDGEVRISYQDRTTYYVTEITSPDGATWGAPVSLTNYIASPNDYLYSGDFGLRLCYRKASNGYLFQVVHNGSSWEAEAEVVSVDIGFTKYIELISGELFLYYRKTSDTKIYSSQYVSGAFGAGVLVVDTASNYLSTAQDVSGIIHILFSPTTGGYLNERTLQRYARVGTTRSIISATEPDVSLYRAGDLWIEP